MPVFAFEATYPRAGMDRQAGEAVRKWLREYNRSDEVVRVTRCGFRGQELIVSFHLRSGSLITSNAVIRGMSLSGMVIEHLWQSKLLEVEHGPDLMNATCVSIRRLPDLVPPS